MDTGSTSEFMPTPAYWGCALVVSLLSFALHPIFRQSESLEDVGLAHTHGGCAEIICSEFFPSFELARINWGDPWDWVDYLHLWTALGLVDRRDREFLGVGSKTFSKNILIVQAGEISRRVLDCCIRGEPKTCQCRQVFILSWSVIAIFLTCILLFR